VTEFSACLIALMRAHVRAPRVLSLLGNPANSRRAGHIEWWIEFRWAPSNQSAELTIAAIEPVRFFNFVSSRPRDTILSCSESSDVKVILLVTRNGLEK